MGNLNKSLSRVHFALGAFYFCIIIFIVCIIGLVTFSNDFEGKDILPTLIILCIFFTVVAFLHLKACSHVKKGTRAGQILSTLLGVFLLVGFPVGTILGIYILSYSVTKKFQYSHLKI